MIKQGSILNHYKSIIIAAIIMVLSVVSTNEIAPHSILIIPYADKFVHFCMYTGLSLILFLEFNKNSFSLNPGILVPILICAVYGGIIEIIQAFIPYRSADFIDLLFDIAGALAGLSVFLLWRKIRY